MNRNRLPLIVLALAIVACGSPLDNASSSFIEQVRLGDPAAQQTYAENRELMESAEALPIWTDALANADSPQVQVWAATLIGNIGDPSALPALATAMEVSRDVRDAAVSAIGKFDVDAAVGAYVLAVESGNREAQAGALAALSRMGSEASGAVPAVAGLATSGQALIADTAINTLGDLGSDEAAAALGGIAMSATVDMDLRARAIQSLRRIESDVATATLAAVATAVADEAAAQIMPPLMRDNTVVDG